MQTTFIYDVDNKDRKWFLVDAKGMTLGRLAVVLANLIRGRNNPHYTPHTDTGAYVVVINAKDVEVTGNKALKKTYMIHTGYRGNEKYISFQHYLAKNPTMIIQKAVEGMMPRNRISRAMLKKLRIFPGAQHDHEAQQPIPYPIAPAA